MRQITIKCLIENKFPQKCKLKVIKLKKKKKTITHFPFCKNKLILMTD